MVDAERQLAVPDPEVIRVSPDDVIGPSTITPGQAIQLHTDGLITGAECADFQGMPDCVCAGHPPKTPAWIEEQLAKQRPPTRAGKTKMLLESARRLVDERLARGEDTTILFVGPDRRQP